MVRIFNLGILTRRCNNELLNLMFVGQQFQKCFFPFFFSVGCAVKKSHQLDHLGWVRLLLTLFVILHTRLYLCTLREVSRHENTMRRKVLCTQMIRNKILALYLALQIKCTHATSQSCWKTSEMPYYISLYLFVMYTLIFSIFFSYQVSQQVLDRNWANHERRKKKSWKPVYILAKQCGSSLIWRIFWQKI